MPTINMLSSAEKIKGQGVGSAYKEQLALLREGMEEDYKIIVNETKCTDIMHYHTINLSYYLTLPFAKSKGVTVGAVHFLPETVDDSLKLSPVARKVFYKYLISFYKSMDYLVTVNPYFIDKLEAYGIARNKVTYIPNFVSEENFYPMEKEEKMRLRKKWDVGPDQFVILGAGQLQTRKGIADFIDIARQRPDMLFIWAGGFSFKNMTSGYKEIKAMIGEAPANVRFPGIVERKAMNELYNIANVMFLPSYNELFPMIILEAMNCHVPILLRDLDIYPNILFDFYMKGHTNEDFMSHLVGLKENTSVNAYYVEKAREGSQYYSKARVLGLWEQFYKEIYSEHHHIEFREATV